MTDAYDEDFAKGYRETDEAVRAREQAAAAAAKARLHPEGAPGFADAIGRVLLGDRAFEESAARARARAERLAAEEDAAAAHRRRMETLAEEQAQADLAAAKGRAGRETFAQLLLLAMAALVLVVAIRLALQGW